MKKLLNIFLAGISTILPISLTLYIFYKVFIFIDGLMSELITQLIGYKIIGLGFISTVLIIFFIGLIAKNFIGQKIIKLTEMILTRIPLAQSIYSAIKEVSDSIFNKSKVSFKQPVLIEFPKDGLKSIGFITNEDTFIGTEEYINVFVPTTPNPTTGFLVLAKREQVEPLNISIDDAMKVIISLGVVTPQSLKKTKIEEIAKKGNSK